MAKLDERMQLIGTAILGQANLESQAIIKKANDIRENEMAAYEEEIVQNMFGKLQHTTHAVRLESMKALAKAELEAHRALLRRREELTRTVFAATRTRLLGFAASPEYLSWLPDVVAAVKGNYDHTSSTLRLRETDLALADKLTALLPGCKVVADGSIKIGGFKLLNNAAGILIDETLDARLVAQKPWFLQHCGLTIL